VVVLDEIDGFAESSAMGAVGKSAAGIYDMYRASVDSRFPKFGKVLALSFPRYKGPGFSSATSRSLPASVSCCVRKS
jgi:hypothetical protein